MEKQFIKKSGVTFLLFFMIVAYCSGQNIIGPDKVCPNTEITYTVNAAPSGATQYDWSISPNRGVITGNGTSTAKIKFWDIDTYTITVTYKIPNGEGGLMDGTPITKSGIQVIGKGHLFIKANIVNNNYNAVCVNTPVEFEAWVIGTVGTIQYQWAGSSTFSTNSKHTVTPTSPGIYTMEVWAKDNCDNTYSPVSTTINVEAPVTVTAYADPAGLVCSGDVVTLTASGAHSYKWSPPTNLSSTVGAVVTAIASETMDYTVTGYSPLGSCSHSKTVGISVYPKVKFTATPLSLYGSDQINATICPGQTATLTGGYGGPLSYPGFTYRWLNSNGTVLGSAQNYSASPSQTTTYTLEGIINGCTTKIYPVVHVLPVPVTPTIAGPEKLCVNPPSQIYNVPTGNTPNGTDGSQPIYTWTISPAYSGGHIGNGYNGQTPSANGQTTTLDFNNVYTGPITLSLEINNQCGTASNEIQLAIDQSIPPAPYIVNGPSSVCNVVGTYTSFYLGGMTAGTEWEITPSNAVQSSSTSLYGMHNVYWSPTFSGTAYVKARIRNGCGASGWSPIKSVAITQKPKIGGFSSVCDDGPIVSYSVGYMVSGSVWSISPANAYVPANTNVSPYGQYNVDWAPGFVGTATISATIPGACGTGPSTKTVTVADGTCAGSGSRGAVIAEVLNASVKPNPFTGTAILSFTNMLHENSTVKIFDAKGMNVYNKENVPSGEELIIGEGLQPGIYSVKIFSENDVKTLRFVKQD